MPIATPREPTEVRRAFADWLTRRTGTPVEVSSFEPPRGGGLSSETFLAATTLDGVATRLVLRLPPHGDGLFPRYDLATQARVLQVLRDATNVPVPSVFAYEDDAGPLGAPFLVMHHADGRIPTDQPPFLATGWVHDLAPDDQRTLQRSFLATVADIHRVDWAAIGLDDLARPGPGSPLGRDLAWWSAYLEWAADGAPVATTRRAFAWCEEQRPAREPAPSLLWGDVRMPNVVF
ncbi:MAG TPA: phosphotransferase family protein, partial [Acidimicrobiia bacterium]|nr:phosphotransferase family protein [Acidimicrobiia bacterium]